MPKIEIGDVVKCTHCTDDAYGIDWCVGRVGIAAQHVVSRKIILVQLYACDHGDPEPDDWCTLYPEHCTKLEPKEYLQYLL